MKITVIFELSENEIIDALNAGLLLSQDKIKEAEKSLAAETKTLDAFLTSEKKDITTLKSEPESSERKLRIAGTKICIRCSNPFKPTSNSQMYCSQKCKKGSPLKAKVVKSKICERCGLSYQPKGNAQRFCPACKDPSVKEDKADPEPAREQSFSVNAPSITYKDVLAERRKAAEDKKILDSLKEHPKIDWDEIKNKKIIQHETISI